MAGSPLNRFPLNDARKIISYECELAVHYQLFAEEALCILISLIFWLKSLNPVFAI
jgi:hypothetical protein